MAYQYNSPYDDLYSKYGVPSPAQPAQPVQPASGQAGYAAPALQGLEHSSEAPAILPGATPAAEATPAAPAQPNPLPTWAQPVAGAIPGLLQALELPVGLSDPEMQTQINMGRRSIQGATNTGLEQMREVLGGRGFTPGSSGVADTEMGKIVRGGAQQQSDYNTSLMMNEANARAANKLALGNLNLNRALGAGALTSALNEPYQFEQTFPYQQQMDALNLLMNYYSQGMAGQQSAWAPYYQGTVNAYTG